MRTKFNPYAALASARSRVAEAAATPATSATHLSQGELPDAEVPNVAAVAAVAEARSDEEAAERAAIVEVDGHMPRVWAERYARLCLMCAPDGIAQDCWQSFIDDCGGFLDRWGGLLVKLGWKPDQLLDVHGRESTSADPWAGQLKAA